MYIYIYLKRWRLALALSLTHILYSHSLSVCAYQYTQTGGHSAAAGHGNMYLESYTAVMERALKPIFAAVGLDFVGRNYAMGGTGSAPEIAMCIESVFGNDVDVISWDYGMVDGRYAISMATYFYRAALLPNRPAGVALHFPRGGNFWGTMKDYEQRGLAMFIMDEKAELAAMTASPDTFGLSASEIAEMPEYVRSFRCADNSVETGDPTCRTEKWNTTTCSKRKYQTSWHPGW
jgi:hypothetical protein